MAGPVHDAPLPAATEGRDALAATSPCWLSLGRLMGSDTGLASNVYKAMGGVYAPPAP
ncbi:MAG: hypothetical protein USCGTAYLOR_02528 [Chromatiales bacterium USCg_Taylor]|nr:MAG: hypothetical protein USCGTAYLOR_02528 [Chromatiales bacterium USCg_Taylor]